MRARDSAYGDSCFGTGEKPDRGYGYGSAECPGYINYNGGGGSDTSSVADAADGTGYGNGDADGYGEPECIGEEPAYP